ncbi:MAG TPA: iduronate-2-sulfatase, partial [Verrucomicrobiales bacterium]|nr:iduronate-2-sulfatase [Verrucomicrobiales bacterium]
MASFALMIQASAKDRPNILLILVDDLKPALGCYGDPLAKTPNIDRLAASGLRFESAYCNQSVCAPSRNNLMLGSRSTSIGIYGLGQHFRDVFPEAVTMPQYFSQHGWISACMGKVLHTGHGNHDDVHSWDHPTYLDKVVEYLKPESTEGGQLTREEAYFTNQKLGQIRSLPKGYAWESADVGDEAYADGRIAAKVIERLKTHQSETNSPFFIMAGFVKPHLPFTAPQKYWDMHDPADFPVMPSQTTPEWAPAFAGKRGGEIVNYAPLTVENIKEITIQRKLMHGYYAAASYADAQIGKVLNTLDELKLGDNTIVVLWGDHGWHLGEKEHWRKMALWEDSTRTPLIIYQPNKIKNNSIVDTPISFIDIYPTLIDMCGLPPKKDDIDGKSFFQLLKNPTQNWDKPVLMTFGEGN